MNSFVMSEDWRNGYMGFTCCNQSWYMAIVASGYMTRIVPVPATPTADR